MDPQQRKLLEVVYETFESAGITLNEVSGSDTACFIATFTADFQQMSFKEHSFRHNLAATGVDPGIISNRISHVFDFKGPSVSNAFLLSLYLCAFSGNSRGSKLGYWRLFIRSVYFDTPTVRKRRLLTWTSLQIVVNTACASSVYAMHNARNALRNKECSAAVVGGVNLVLTVDQHMNTAKLGKCS